MGVKLTKAPSRRSESLSLGSLGPAIATGIALLLATSIFVIDRFTSLGFAAAALYVVVVLLSGRLATRRNLVAIGLGCIGLTLLAYALQHGEDGELGPLARCLGSLVAITLATFIAVKSQETGATLREHAGLLELTHDGVFVRDTADKITYWNRAATELYGWSSGEAIGRTSNDLLHTVFPADLSDIQKELDRDGRWEGELTRRRKDGRPITVAGRWSLQRDDKLRPTAILETSNDISERKRNEEERQERENELRIFIDTIPTLGWICRPDGSAEYLNKRWLDYTGLTLDEAQGWNWKSVFHPDDLDRMLAHYAQCLTTGQPFEDEGRLRRFDGSYRWLLFRAEARRDASGEILKWYGTNTDIEELKTAELAVMRSQAYLDEAQRLSHTGSFAWKPSTDEIVWSRETYQILGVDPDVVPTVDLMLARVHEDDRDLVNFQIERANGGEREYDYEHRMLTPHGDLRNLHVRACLIKYPSGEEEIVGAMMDVTATKRAQSALQAAQADLAHATRIATLGEISASIAHEVNQPLAAIVTHGEATLRWLKRTTPDIDEALSSVTRIVAESNRAADVIHRIRGLAKKADANVVSLDVVDVIEDVVPLVRHEASAHQVIMRMELNRSLPEITCDRIELQQVLINLIMNGIQAMSAVSDRPRVLVVRTVLQGDGYVLISVQDAGTGIGSKATEDLFTAFFTTKQNGMGMGLSICRSIIESHGGRIWAVSNDGPGMLFQFTVPTVTVTPRTDASQLS